MAKKRRYWIGVEEVFTRRVLVEVPADMPLDQVYQTAKEGVFHKEFMGELMTRECKAIQGTHNMLEEIEVDE